MSAVIPSGFGQYRWQFSVPGQSGDVMCVGGFSSSEETDANQMAEDIATFVEGGILPSLNDELILLGVTVVFNTLGVFAEGFHISGETGGMTGDVFPPNNAVLVRKLTNLAGRQNRGRFYLPGITKADVQNQGLYEDTPRAALQDSIDTAFVAFQLAGYEFQILHDEDGPYAADAPAQVRQLYVEQKTATQRTRLRD